MIRKFSQWCSAGLVVLVLAGCTSDADQTAADIDEAAEMEFATPADAENPCAAEAAAEPMEPEAGVAANPCATAAPAAQKPAAEKPVRKPMAKVVGAIADLEKADPRIEDFIKEAAGYAVFPSVGKGAFLIGGAHGDGELIVGGSAVGTTEMTEISVGLQAGGQAFTEIIFFESDADIERFKSGKLEFSSGFSAVMADGGASNKPAYREGVVVFSLPKGGMMAEMSVGGQKFKFKPY